MNARPDVPLEASPPRVATVDEPCGLAPATLSAVDRWGMVVSSLCLVHCLALPVIVAALPALGSLLPDDFAVHLVLILVAMPLTGFALWRGERTHGERLPLLLGFFGLLLIGAAVPLSAVVPLEIGLTVIGGLIVVTAHLLNWSAHRRGCVVPGHGH